jgi:hypothetical protein
MAKVAVGCWASEFTPHPSFSSMSLFASPATQIQTRTVFSFQTLLSTRLHHDEPKESFQKRIWEALGDHRSEHV